jgi:TATA-box binding protein (TBP) (component of TFIID and TFIIIB)
MDEIIISFPQIVNISLSCHLNYNLDLEMLTIKSTNCIYNKFAAVILRDRYESNGQLKNVTMMVFKNGRVNCTGGNDLDNAKGHMDKMIRSVLHTHNITKFNNNHNTIITNIVSIIKVNKKINLYNLENYFNSLNRDSVSIQFEPELFSGLTLYYITNGENMTFKIFNSGKINLMGIKSESGILLAYDFIKKHITLFLTRFTCD